MSAWSEENDRIAAGSDPETNEMFDRATSSDGGRHVQNTDLGNARRLVAAHGSRVRYAPEWGMWLPWDGRRWAPDVTGQIDRIAKQVAESILDQARAGGDKDLFSWGLRSQSRAGIANMIKLAETEPGIPVLVDQFDADPWLFNTMSGTVDLRSGETRTRSKRDLITKLAPVAYDPDAECPTWDRFLADVFGDDDLIGFVRRAAGYSLTGHTLEQILIFCFGTGGNGKTTFLNVLRAVFGDYGMQLDPAVLTLSAHEQHPTGLTDLPRRPVRGHHRNRDGQTLERGPGQAADRLRPHPGPADAQGLLRVPAHTQTLVRREPPSQDQRHRLRDLAPAGPTPLHRPVRRQPSRPANGRATHSGSARHSRLGGPWLPRVAPGWAWHP